MNNQSNRRQFIKNSALTGCTLLVAGKLSAFTFPEDKVPDPKKLNYCGYTCPDNCQFLEATVKNDRELKKKAFNTWKLDERYGVSFDENTAFCWGCKAKNKPEGAVVSNCTVRSCAVKKKHDSCIQCKSLSNCDKDLWKRFPDFHKSVQKMQQSYFEAQA